MSTVPPARSLIDAGRNLNAALDEPYETEAINQWILISRKILQSNAGGRTRPIDIQPPAEDQQDIQKDRPQSQQNSLFESKPVPFSQEKSFLIVTDMEGVILGSDDE